MQQRKGPQTSTLRFGQAGHNAGRSQPLRQRIGYAASPPLSTSALSGATLSSEIPMRMNVTLRQLRVFCAVYERRSFTSAADDMHMTQSAVSKLCAELESEIGLPLFERTTRRVTPCDGAAELYEYAQEVLNTMRLAGRRLSALRTLDQGNLSIAASPMMMSGLLAPVIEAFARDHPQVRIDLHELTTDESVDYVRTGRCDFGLVSIAEHDPQLEPKVVCAELLCLACTPSHPLAAKKRITWGEASDYPHITLRSVYSTRKTIDRILKAQGLELRSTIQAGTLATSLRLVKANLGVTLIPSYAREFAQELGLKVMEIYDKKSYPHELSLLTRRGLKPSIAATAFMDALQVHLQGRARRRQHP